jgi:hypothetical protein
VDFVRLPRSDSTENGERIFRFVGSALSILTTVPMAVTEINLMECVADAHTVIRLYAILRPSLNSRSEQGQFIKPTGSQKI